MLVPVCYFAGVSHQCEPPVRIAHAHKNHVHKKPSRLKCFVNQSEGKIMRNIKHICLSIVACLSLCACTPSGVGFDQLDYSIHQKKMLGHIEVIISPQMLNQKTTLSAASTGKEGDQVMNTGQMLSAVADHEFSQQFILYNRVGSLKEIKPGFYRAIMSLAVVHFAINHQELTVSILAKIYSYQGHLLYQKIFTGSAIYHGDLQTASLMAYKQAMLAIRKRLQQVLYWEQNSSSMTNS